MEIVDNQSKQHWGSYDAVDHGFDSRMQSPFGAEPEGAAFSPPQPGAPVAPDWSELLSAGWEHQGTIKRLRGPAVPPVMAALAFMSAPPLPPGSLATHIYTAMPVMQPNAWVQSYVAAGYTVLIDMISPISQDGSRKLALVPSGQGAAANVAGKASAGMPFAVVDGPQDVIAAAAAFQPQPVAPPPTQPPVQPPGSGPSMGTKLAVAGGAIAAGALLVYFVTKDDR